MIRTEKRLRLGKALICCILVFIWGNSLMPASVSSAFSGFVARFFTGLLPEGGPGISGEGPLRKFAHFTEFAALGMALGWVLGMLGRRKRVPLLLGLAAACVDETIQRFVPGRSPGLRDVAIDTCGVAVGIGLLYLGHHLFRRHKSSTLEDQT